MSDIILNNKEQDVLAGTIESSILTPEDVAKIKTRSDIAQLRTELEKINPQGELLRALKAEIVTANQPQDEFDGIRAIMNGSNVPGNTPSLLVVAPASVEAAVVAPAVGTEVKNENLPVAPVTTFNIIRLMQLGYIPMDKPGKLMSPKWVFYGPNVANQYVNGKVNGWALDWSDKKGGSAYRAMLDVDISNLNNDIKAYQKNTATVFGVKVELEKQLALLESLKTERDPKKIISLANDYVLSRSKTNFSHGAVGYADPAVRKTTAQLDAEVIHVEGKTQITEDFIKNTEQDLKAITVKGELDSKLKSRETLDDINKKYDKAIQEKGIDLQRKLTAAETRVKQPKIDYDNAQNVYKKVETRILELQSKLDTAPDVKPIKPNAGGFFPMTKAEINLELDKLGRIDSRGMPGFTGTSQELYLASRDLRGAKNIYEPLQKEVDKLNKRLLVYKNSLNANRNKEIDTHNTRKANLEKQLQQAQEAFPKRQEKELKIAELNGKIKTVETKLAGSPTTSERLKLESDLRELYAQKNAAAHAFTTAIEANKGRNDSQTQAAVEGQTKEVQKELSKLSQLSVEMNEVKTKIDSIQAEVEVAKNALNNEKDPVKAKKLRDEMPAKINAANAQIFELNQAGSKICTSAGINWKTIPDLELKSVLQRNLLLSKFLAAPQGAIARVESFGQTPGGQKTMKMVYGGLRWVGVAGAARTVGNEMAQGKMKEAGLDAFDAGMGFVGMIPGGNIVSGIYDIGMAGKQFVTGTDINGRNVSTSQSFVRLGFGIVGLIPVVGNIVKGAAAAKGAIKTVSAVEKVESAANLAMKGAVLTQVATVTYDVVDITANMFREPVADVAMRVVRGQEQPGIFFPKSITK